MVNTNSLWRPNLFAAAGTGFDGDPQLNNGLHARWHIDHRLGLPMEANGVRNGVFRVFRRTGGPVTISNLDLIGGALNPPFPVHDTSIFTQGAGLIVRPNALSFWQRPALDLALLFVRLRSVLDSNPSFRWMWRETDQDEVLRRYVNAVVNSLQPELLENTPLRARTDACAVDVSFSGIASGAPSTNGEPFLFIEGLDRAGRIVAHDWVGQLPSGAPKTIARLRDAGFATVRLSQVPGQPVVTRTQAKWVLSEDYCRASGWAAVDEHWFNADPGFHTVDQAIEHFAPFKALFSPDQVADAVGNFLLEDADLKKLFQLGEDTFSMAIRSAAFAEAGDARAGKIDLSLLQSLVASGVDPIMARILGLYGFIDPANQEPRGEDLLIEAHLPFFNPANLDQIDTYLQALYPDAGNNFFRNATQTLTGRALSALIVNPNMGPKPPVPAPGGFSTAIRSNALPAQGTPDQIELLVGTDIDAPIDPVETAPELTPVAYLVERQVSGGGFDNVAEYLGESDILDDIGILPPVYFPARERGDWQEPLKIADDFTLNSLDSETVQYRITAFDIFGRTSSPALGAITDIEPPCTPPPPPVNPVARVTTDAGRLVLEIDFALNSETPPLEAAWQRLEIVVHQLPPSNPLNPDPSPPGAARWSGKVPARHLAIDVLPGNSLHSAMVQSCVELEWSPDLSVTSAPAAVCATQFPLPAPEMISIDPISASFANTGLRSHRLRITIGSTTGMTAGPYRWCARFVTVGTCSASGNNLDSQEVCTAADWLVHAPAPQAASPVTTVVPLTSFPDTQGDSWYDLDLSMFGLADGDRINIYKTRLHRLGDGATNLVADGTLQDLTLFEQMARASHTPYERENSAPIQFSATNPFHRIRVEGNRRDIFVLAVVGTNSYQQEQRWADAAVTLFTTPDKLPEPRLKFVQTTRSVDTGERVLLLEYAADFVIAPPALSPPKVQLFRRDLSARQSRLSYIGEALGTLAPPPPGAQTSTRYQFVVEDRKQDDWHSYAYEAQLIRFEPATNSFLRGQEPAKALARADWDGAGAPVRATDRISVAPGIVSGLDVNFEFDCGEFEFTLVRAVAGKISSRFSGRLRNGQLFGLTATHELEIVTREGRKRYRLKLHDADAVAIPAPGGADEPQDGLYILRVSFGEQATWTNRENDVS